MVLVKDLLDRLSIIAESIGLPHDSEILMSHVSNGIISLEHSEDLQIQETQCSWHQYYPILSFLISGHLYVDYHRLNGLLGFPTSLSTQRSRIVHRLEEHVTDLTEWSCGQVQQEITKQGDGKKWMASFDGFYLTWGHIQTTVQQICMTTPLGTSLTSVQN